MSRRPPSARDPQNAFFRALPAIQRVVPGALASRAATPLPRPLPYRQAVPSDTDSPVELVNTVAASGSTETLPDVTVATVHYVTLTANCTFTFPTAAAGKSFTLVLVQDGTGSRTATWPASVKWAAGTAPTLTATASKRDAFSFLCADGSTWFGFTAGLNYS